MELAKESSKTLKTREKLKKYFAKVDESITKQALERKVREIHRWIARHATHRVQLKKKAFALFDENQNGAPMSNRIHSLSLKIKQENEHL